MGVALREVRKVKIRRHSPGRKRVRPDLLFTDDKGRALNPLTVTRQIAEVMEGAGIPFHKIHAFRKTGLLPTEDNLALLSEKDLAEWDAAIEEGLRIEAAKSPR